MMKKLKKERKFLGNTLVSKQEAGVFDAKLFLLCAMHIDLVVVLANCHHGKRHLCSLVQQVVVHKHCSKQFFCRVFVE